MYAPIVLLKVVKENKYDEKIYLLESNKDNKELKELLYFYKNPFMLNKDIKFKIVGQLLQKNQHKEFIQHLWFFLYRLESVKEMCEFLKTCDIHSQKIYTSLINKSLRLGVRRDTIESIFGKIYPPFEKRNIKGYHSIVKHKENIFIENSKYMKWDKDIINIIKQIPLKNLYILGEFRKNSIFYISEMYTNEYEKDELITLKLYTNLKKYFGSKLVIS